MERIYYPLVYRLNERAWYMLWYVSKEEEGITIEKNGRIPVFTGMIPLEFYAKTQGINLIEHEPEMHDLDVVNIWIQKPYHEIPCIDFTIVWNLFSDMAKVLNKRFLGDLTDERVTRLYNRMLWSNNNPAMRPANNDGEAYWSEEELQIVYEIMNNGMKTLMNADNMVVY